MSNELINTRTLAQDYCKKLLEKYNLQLEEEIEKKIVEQILLKNYEYIDDVFSFLVKLKIDLKAVNNLTEIIAFVYQIDFLMRKWFFDIFTLIETNFDAQIFLIKKNVFDIATFKKAYETMFKLANKYQFTLFAKNIDLTEDYRSHLDQVNQLRNVIYHSNELLLNLENNKIQNGYRSLIFILKNNTEYLKYKINELKVSFESLSKLKNIVTDLDLTYIKEIENSFLNNIEIDS